MKIDESLIIMIIFLIIFILFSGNKKSKKGKNDANNSDIVYYRNSHSVYRDDINNESKNEYKKYRYNINNYTLKRKLLRESEFDFYNILKSSMDTNYIICPKVKISNFIEMIDKRSWEDYYNKINYQSIDFLICNQIFKPIFGIILFYGNPKIQTENEIFLNEIYTSINLPILKFELSDNYPTETIKEQIVNLFKTIETISE